MRIETLKPGQAADGGPRFTPPERSPAPHMAKLQTHLPAEVEMVRALLSRADGYPAADANLAGLTAQEIFAESLRRAGVRPPENDVALIRAVVGTQATAAILDDVLYSAILDGYREARATIDGWTSRVELPNFLPHDLYVLEPAAGLRRLGRGERAPEASVVIGVNEWALSRYGATLTLDETDALDDAFVGALVAAGRRLGDAAKRVEVEAVMALLLRNDEMADGERVFAEARGNIGSAALDATSLAAAAGAMGNQVARATDGSEIVLNPRPAVLLVPPDLHLTAAKLLADLATGDDDDLALRVDARLSRGMTDPESGERLDGSETGWFLVADPKSCPGVIVANLAGSGGRPTVTQFVLDKGEWGVGWSVAHDVAEAVGDARGLYRGGVE